MSLLDEGEPGGEAVEQGHAPSSHRCTDDEHGTYRDDRHRDLQRSLEDDGHRQLGPGITSIVLSAMADLPRALIPRKISEKSGRSKAPPAAQGASALGRLAVDFSSACAARRIDALAAISAPSARLAARSPTTRAAAAFN